VVEFDLLLEAKLVVPDSTSRPLSPGFVAIRGSRVQLVGEGRPVGISAQRKIVVRDGIIIPGLVSTHDHMYGVLAHGIPVNREIKGFRGFLEDFWWPRVEERLDIEGIRAAVEVATLERLKSGTTCVADILEAPNAIPGALDAEATVVERAGMRAILSFEATERVSRENGRKGLEENSSFIARRNVNAGLVKGMHCIHTTFTCSPSFIRKCREDANASGAGIQIHLEESPYESARAAEKYRKTPVEIYDNLGFWGPDVIASQCVQTTPEEIKTLAKHCVSVSHQPLSNGEVGGGIAPVPRMLDQGLAVGLGTDGFIVDMFEVMRGAWLLHKAASVDPSVLPASQVFKMATETGARILGTGAGAIKPGLKADLVVLEDRFPTPVTPENAVTQLVTYGSGRLVSDVVVDGKVAVRAGKALHIDADSARQRGREAARRLWSSTGFQSR
jgi:cytosine/adenosine deaminase-related metal-dependent hydrolase